MLGQSSCSGYSALPTRCWSPPSAGSTRSWPTRRCSTRCGRCCGGAGRRARAAGGPAPQRRWSCGCWCSSTSRTGAMSSSSGRCGATWPTGISAAWRAGGSRRQDARAPGPTPRGPRAPRGPRTRRRGRPRARVTSGRRLRIDTTVVEAPDPPPDRQRAVRRSVRVLSHAVRRLGPPGCACRGGARCPSQCEPSDAGDRAGHAAAGRRRDRGDPAAVSPVAPGHGTGGPPGCGECRGRGSAARWVPSAARRVAARALTVLEMMLPRAAQVIAQTRARILRRETKSPDKLVSLFEPYTRILRHGKPRRPTEFGGWWRSRRPRPAS